MIVPTLNEASAIGKVLSEMPMDLVNEVIVVDSSDDSTPKIAESLGAKVIHETRKGYGRALQTGIENARGEIVVYIDGDYTYDPREMRELVKPIIWDKCDVVLGSRLRGRLLPGSMDRVNKVGNLILSAVFSTFFLERIDDTQTGFRAIRRSLLEGISYRDYGMPYVTEQLTKLVKRGVKIASIPVTYRPRVGSTKLRLLADGFRILRSMLRGRFAP